MPLERLCERCGRGSLHRDPLSLAFASYTVDACRDMGCEDDAGQSALIQPPVVVSVSSIVSTGQFLAVTSGSAALRKHLLQNLRE
jgi:hypothetical protein